MKYEGILHNVQFVGMFITYYIFKCHMPNYHELSNLKIMSLIQSSKL